MKSFLQKVGICNDQHGNKNKFQNDSQTFSSSEALSKVSNYLRPVISLAMCLLLAQVK